jgi:hypothetical protein
MSLFMGAVGTRLGIPIVRGGCPPPEQAAGHEAESETQIARQAEDDGGVGTGNATVDDLQIGREIKPRRKGDVVEELHTRSVVRV